MVIALTRRWKISSEELNSVVLHIVHIQIWSRLIEATSPMDHPSFCLVKSYFLYVDQLHLPVQANKGSNERKFLPLWPITLTLGNLSPN